MELHEGDRMLCYPAMGEENVLGDATHRELNDLAQMLVNQIPDDAEILNLRESSEAPYYYTQFFGPVRHTKTYDPIQRRFMGRLDLVYRPKEK